MHVHMGKTNSTQYIVCMCVCKTIIFIEEQERNLRECLCVSGGGEVGPHRRKWREEK